MPNVSQVTRSVPLTGVVIAFTPAELVAHRIMKALHVVPEVGEYTVLDRDSFEVPDTFRADGDPSKRVTTGWKYEPYQLVEHSLHDKITARQRKQAGDQQFNLESVKAKALKQRIWNRVEATVFGSGGILRTPANNGGSTNGDLSNLATASPRTAIQSAVDAVELNTGGTAANTIAIATDVLRHITRTAEYRDETKYTNDLSDNEGLPLKLYGLNVVKVAASLANGVKKGQSKVPTSRLLNDDIWVGYVPETESIVSEELAYGAMIRQEEEMRTWWENKESADYLEYSLLYDLKVVAKECGYLIQSVLNR